MIVVLFVLVSIVSYSQVSWNAKVGMNMSYPGILAIAAVQGCGTSKADCWNKEYGVYLSKVFTCSLVGCMNESEYGSVTCTSYER